jgi:hypothetical protein
MAHRNAITSAPATGTTRHPHVTSYDSGYEHSLEHWTEVQRLVQEADEESGVVHRSADHGILVGA